MSEPELALFVLAGSGEDPGPAVAALAAAGWPHARVVTLTAAGAWAQARNAALAAAGGAELIAFVEAGVTVGKGWGPAPLLDDPALGLLGGPLTAVGAATWLDTVAHAQVLGLTGMPQRPVAGNAIARTAALRAIGGFRPVRGHRHARDELADWQRALQELERAGWGVAVSDALAATRDIGAVGLAELLARRAQTGARTRVLAPEHAPARPLSGAARSAVAAAARALRADGAGARDRLAWAAAGAGAALGDALAHRGLQPGAARTELLPAVPAPLPHPLRPRLPVVTRRAGRGGLILLYHRVAELDHDPQGIAVTPAQFAEQLAILKRDRHPATLADVASGRVGPRGVAVTFDDGYHDNLVHALPALAAAGVPATLFACTGPIAAGTHHWWDRVEHAVRAGVGQDGRGTLTLTLPGGARSWRAPADADALIGELRTALWTLPSETIDGALAELEAWAGTTATGVPQADRQLTVAELRELAAAGPFEIGAHTRSHVSLAFMDPERRRAELVGGADDLEDWLGRRPAQLAYPYGTPGVDVDGATIAAARDAGYTLAVVNGGRHLTRSRSRSRRVAFHYPPSDSSTPLDRRGAPPLALALPRRGVPALDGERFAAWLRAVAR